MEENVIHGFHRTEIGLCTFARRPPPRMVQRISRWFGEESLGSSALLQESGNYRHASWALEGPGCVSTPCWRWRTHHLATGRPPSSPVSTARVHCVAFEQDTKLLWESAVSATGADTSASVVGSWSRQGVLKFASKRHSRGLSRRLFQSQ